MGVLSLRTALLTNRQSQVVTAILERLDNLPEPAAANRRKSRRTILRVSLWATLLAVHGMPRVGIHTRNISTSGLGFLSQRAFRSHERIAISLVLPSFPGKLILCQVCFSRYLRSGIYEVGTSFEEAIPIPSEGATVPLRWVLRANPDTPKN